MSRDGDTNEDEQTIFVVFFGTKYETKMFCGAFYTFEKAQEYCENMRKFAGSGYYTVEEVEIK